VVVAAISRNHGLGLVVHGQPELVPGGSLTIACADGVDLLQSRVRKLEDIDHAHNLATVVHDGKVEVVAICEIKAN
jgi:hypothetical protein